jgi:hypothetical protein
MAQDLDADLVEYIGADKTQRADPPKRKAVAPVVQPLAEELATPAPSKPGSHPKHAIKAPRLAYEAAQEETVAALAELRSATKALNLAETAEADALNHWLSQQPKADTDALLRDYANSAVEQRAANVAAGLPPEGIKTPTHNKSPVDVAAANRARPSPQVATVPLRKGPIFRSRR